MVQGEFLVVNRHNVDQSRRRPQRSTLETGRKEHTMFEIIDQPPQSGAIIKVIGVGGCGGNAVEHMIDRGLARRRVHLREHRRAGAEALDGAAASCSLAAALTRGLGAGARPEIGRDAAMEDRDRIAELIEGADMLFITAGMGGGTGTGAAPVIADIAKSMNILTVAVVTRPFKLEGGKRMKVAQAGIDELAKRVDSLIIIPNDKLMEVLGDDISMLDAYAAANDVLHGAVSGIAEVINNPGLVNVDFADVRTVMGEVGMAMMGSAMADGRGSRAAGGGGGGAEPAARGRQPGRRTRRARQRHGVVGPARCGSTRR